MKILLIILLSINVSLACQNKIPFSEAQKAVNGDSGAGSKACKDLPNEQCLCFDGVNFNKSELRISEVDDLDSPIYAEKQDVESCVDEPDCQSILGTKTCTDGTYNAVYTLSPNEVYCTKHLGYEQSPTGSYEFYEDATKAGSYDSAKALLDADSAAMEAAFKYANCGRRVKARLLLRNAPKGLSNGQKKQLVSTYRDINDLLSVGSLDAARAEILAVVPDGTLVTAADQTALVAELDACNI